MLGKGYLTPLDVGEPSTPLAMYNDQDTLSDGYFTPPDLQVGSFQPTPKGSKFWVPKVNNKPVQGTVFDTLELALKAYKNYARECGFEVWLNEFIGNDDAQMVVHKMLSRQEFFEDFSVKYKRDEDTKELLGLFWADAYNMVLVPFTGIDNHNRSMIFAAVVVTDQDPAMKLAIKEILPNTRHRLCMWHIMAKPTTKVGTSLCRDTNFKRRLCDIVWTDKIKADVFDEHWNEIMADFKLTEHKWLHDMFELRSQWIPTYFRHEPMSRLMRTTSRSESVQEDDTSFNYVIHDTKADYKLNGVSIQVIYENALPSKLVGRPIDAASSSNPEKYVNGVLREIYANVEDSVTRLVTDIEKLYTYKDELTTLLEQLKINIPNPPEMNRKELYDVSLGVTEPEQVNIVAPICHNKGSVSTKRLQTHAEIAMVQSKKTATMQILSTTRFS
uniref:MULE transposase domain-containing protein n=1 Tax=Tanacetum cinerariifolium TaxID=118510 RepID=A0A699HKM5_TANCI|nr:hypothetical protein [Tanacetum cinerariifolium]